MKKTITISHSLEFLLLLIIFIVFPSVTRAETIQIYASAGDGAITSGSNSPWNISRWGSFTDVNDTASERNVYTDNSYSIRRLYFPFDTSSIPSGAQITSATLHLTHPHNNYLDDDMSAGLLMGNQVSSATLTTSDWEPSSFVRIADDIDMTSFTSTNQTISYELNDIGRGSIEKGAGGMTSIVLATSADIDNDLGSVGGGGYVDIYMSETSGTSKDPYLEITYMNGTTTAPTSLKVNGQTSPQTVSDDNLDFTMYYESFNGVGKATHYEIQVSTSSSDWSEATLGWGSKKTPFSQSVASGTTSPVVTSPGVLLIADTTYYWRARIWDEYGNISNWSSTANFKTDDTLTVRIYPEAGDGAITSGSNSPWSTARSGSFTDVNDTASERNVYTDNSYSIRRLYFPFDTSVIPSDAAVSAATFNLVHPHNLVLNGGFSVGLIEGDMADMNNLSTADWNPTSFDRLSSDKAMSSFTSANQTVQWMLNATGTNAINLGNGASTTLILATSADIDNNSGTVGGGGYVDLYMSESYYPPYLEVTYSR